MHDFRKTLVALNKGFKSVKGCTFKNKYDVFQHNDLFSCVCLPVFFGGDFLLLMTSLFKGVGVINNLNY